METVELILLVADSADPQPAWIQILIAGATGGLAVKLLDVIYQEVRNRRERNTTVEQFVQTQLDPVLKAADEVVGKTYSITQEDFGALPNTLDPKDLNDSDNVDLASILFLFAQFWATIEILRRESIYVRLAESHSGAKLTKFLSCLESRRVRALVRARQRAIGELLIVPDRTKLRPMGFSEFIAQLDSDSVLGEWLKPLRLLFVEAKFGSRSQQTKNRQQLLQYALILHAMIDDLDQGHTTTKPRPPLTGKLSPNTRRNLQHRIFKVYLPFVREADRYWSHPEKRSGARGHG